MMKIDEHTKAELIGEIATTLPKKQRLTFASDFLNTHSVWQELLLKTFRKGQTPGEAMGML